MQHERLFCPAPQRLMPIEDEPTHRLPIWDRHPGGCLAAGCGFIVVAAGILSIAVAVALLSGP